jgi:hypothetical protein
MQSHHGIHKKSHHGIHGIHGKKKKKQRKRKKRKKREKKECLPICFQSFLFFL